MDFKKNKDYLVCIDSDGCVMDTMDIKHHLVFGPVLLNHFEFSISSDELLSLWNDINLYKITRGINRFLGLATILKQLDNVDATDIVNFTETSKELSNEALEKAILETGSASLKKALAWSVEVNKNIKKIDKSKLVSFKGSLEALKHMKNYADIAVVSSANAAAVLEEWEDNNLLEHVDVVLTQADGSKAHCISKLLELGYNKEQVLMIGDALGDYDAAKKNDVSFYPILVKKEESSFVNLVNNYFTKFIKKNYSEVEAEIVNIFMKNLE